MTQQTRGRLVRLPISPLD